MVGVKDRAVQAAAGAGGHLQGVGDQTGAHMVDDGPADDLPAEAVQHGREIEELSVLQGQAGDVAHVSDTGFGYGEVSAEQVRDPDHCPGVPGGVRTAAAEFPGAQYPVPQSVPVNAQVGGDALVGRPGCGLVQGHGIGLELVRVVPHRHRRSSRFLRIKQIQYQRVHHSGGGSDFVPVERGLRHEPVPLPARTWRRRPRAPTAQPGPTVPGPAQHSWSLIPASGQQGGSAPSRITCCHRTYPDRRSDRRRNGSSYQARSGLSHQLCSHHGRGFGTARRPACFSARSCAAYSFARASHSTRASCASSTARDSASGSASRRRRIAALSVRW